MDPLELLELTDNLTDALDQLASADPDDALATLDAVEAVQAALEAMGESVTVVPVETLDTFGFSERDYAFLTGVINGDYSSAAGDILKGLIQRGDSITLELSKQKKKASPKANQLVQDAMLVLLSMPTEPAPQPAQTNPLYQSVLDGAAVTIDLVKQVRAEGQKDPDHPQLRPAVRVIHGAVKAMAA